LAYHAVDVDLGGVLVSDVIEDEDFFFAACLDGQFVIAFGEVDALGEVGVARIGFEANNHLDLLLSVETTVVSGFHRYY
jgi:hypothetical protein